MPPKKDGQAKKPAAAKSSSSQQGSAEKINTKVTNKTGFSVEDMNHMVLEENAKLLAKVQELESSNKNSSTETSAEGKSKELEEMKKQIEQKDKEINKIEELKKENVKMKLQVAKLEDNFDFKFEELEVKLNELKTTNKEITENRKSLKKEIEGNDKEITELNKKLSASERLNKMMGDQITENNSDIDDLSDLNRPTKLAEKYSELYDNEWTDAYEEMENNSMNTKEILRELFEILKDIYLFSQKISYDYEKNVRSSALTIPGIQGRPSTSNLNSSTRKQLVDLRKTFAPLLSSDFFKHYLRTCIGKTDERPKTKRFMNLCAEICWLMSVQDPPVVFELEEPKGRFDKEKYKFYTKPGNQIDFIVWPPMKLHQTGPLLAKGVAQAK